MDGYMNISLDLPPLKRIAIVEENGAEQFPNDVTYDAKLANLISRIDFDWAVERENPSKKRKNNSTNTPWPWQSLVENLQLAQQELSIIIDLDNNVEANDVVTVAGMSRLKPSPNEQLADLSVSTATKLQSFRKLGKYFKQSAKALEKEIGQEARFYGELFRVQRNWKVKLSRKAASVHGNEGFYIDLFDNSLSDPTVWVERNSDGTLALKLPSNARHSLKFGFVGANLVNTAKQSITKKTCLSGSELSEETKKKPISDDECVKKTNSVLREMHRELFDKQVFDLVSHEAFVLSDGRNVTGIGENHLVLNINQEASVYISLVPSNEADIIPNFEGNKRQLGMKSKYPTQLSYEILLQQIFQEHVFVKIKDRTNVSEGIQSYDKSLSHFCFSLAHRIFSNKVLMALENVVSKVPYVQLISNPTWHSRTSSWILFVEMGESYENVKSSQFRTKVVVNDDCISVVGEGFPNVVGLFKGKYETNICYMNKFDCNLEVLPVILLQQIANQIIGWLHEEALMVGIKVNREFLCLTFEMEEGETPSLVAHVDPEDSQGGICWWLVMKDGLNEDYKVQTDISESETRKFLGYLSLDLLYSILLDLVSLCGGGSGGGNHQGLIFTKHVACNPN